MRFIHTRNGVIQFGTEAIAVLHGFRQLAPEACEAGGLLLGRYLRGGHNIVVDGVTEPLPEDTRTRATFQRSTAHNALIERAWRESGGTVNCVGCWHTHPEPWPTPSQIDMDDWLRMLREDVLADEACFFVIVGTERTRVWVGDKRTMSIVVCPEGAWTAQI